MSSALSLVALTRCQYTTSKHTERESPMLMTEWEGPKRTTQHTVPVPPLLLPAPFSSLSHVSCFPRRGVLTAFLLLNDSVTVIEP